ncbi:MAG: GspH/FimT family pseudopilin [Candidatus Krumholzibacteria bacterium]|nr:GspH/FimT family pseudopilin [Candidatus Krumholzibacteria bacterium]
MMRKKENNRGFTLTELMIVISIMGMLAILIMPGYNKFMANWRLNGDTQELATALRTARSTAVMKNIDVVFEFDTDSQTYSYFEDKDRNGNRGTDEYMSATHEMSPGVKIAGHTFSGTILTFGSKGNARESGSITLRNVYYKIRGVEVFGGTGNITVD